MANTQPKPNREAADIAPQTLERAPATQPALVTPDTRKRAPAKIKATIGWLRGNGFSLVCFAIAAKVAYSATILALNPITTTTQMGDNPPEVTVSNPYGGFGLMFVLYMMGALRLADARTAQLARTLPFVLGVLWIEGCVAWAVIFETVTNYAPLIAMLLFGVFVVGGMAAIAYDGIGDIFGASSSPSPPPPTTVGNSKFGGRDLLNDANLSDDWIEGKRNE